jgi:hypothetical protein
MPRRQRGVPVPHDTPLTPRQRLFVREYVRTANVTEAATLAGYSPHTARVQGQRMLLNPRIQSAVTAEQVALQRRTNVTVDAVVQVLWREAQGDGPDTSSAARVRAAELLGRHLGMFQDGARPAPSTVVNLITTIRDGDLALARALLSGEALPAQPKVVQALAPRDDLPSGPQMDRVQPVRPLAPTLGDSALPPALPSPADATPVQHSDCARGEGGGEGEACRIFLTTGDSSPADPIFEKVDAPSGCDIFPTEFGDPVDPLRVFREEGLDGGEIVG